MDNTVKVTAEKVYRRKLFTRIVKMALLVLLLFFSILYLILYYLSINPIYFVIKNKRQLKKPLPFVNCVILIPDTQLSRRFPSAPE